MKKKSIDGLPGLTMQGTKGQTGKRGYTTYYNYNEVFTLVTQDDTEKTVYGEYSLAFSNSSETSGINTEICIPSFSITPIIHDRLLNTAELGLDLYEIEDIIPIEIVETVRGKKELTKENIQPALKEKFDVSSASYKFIYEQLNKRLSFYMDNPSLVEDVISDIENNFSIYILKKLDTLNFSQQKTSSDINEVTVSLKSSVISYNAWQKAYAESDSSLNLEEFDRACTPHKYNIILDDRNVNRIMQTIALMPDPDHEEGLFRSDINELKIRIYSSNSEAYDEFITGKEVRVMGFDFDGTNTNFPNVIMNTPDSWEVGEKIENVMKVFDETTTIGMLENINTRLTADDENYHAKLIKVSCNGYWPSYYSLNKLNWHPDDDYSSMIDPQNINVYLYEITSDIGSSVKTEINAVDYYPYIDTSLPVTRAIDVDEEGKDIVVNKKNDLAIIKFSVFLPISVKDREKIAIYAEFTSTRENYVYKMDSVRSKLWDAPEDPEDKESIIEAAFAAESYPFGKIQYYKNINFDREETGDFVMLVKDFDEGITMQTYTSKKIFPAAILETHGVSLFMYYKISNAAYQKIYLGTAELAESVE